jgi:hypothetical protein
VADRSNGTNGVCAHLSAEQGQYRGLQGEVHMSGTVLT